ncbi:MAG: exonuclease SbcC, partial [Thermus sp.]
MRPFRLELEGFGPYREKQVVDFSDVELFAITGPTGSGKSTLLEAMAFALFKRTPRGQSLEELRHPNAPKVRVVLDFQVAEGVYRVVRHLEAQGGRLLSQDQLFRQEATRWEKVETTGVRGLNQTLEALLGLTYEAFTKALLLPQGEFDRLLKGEARERRALFQSLFGLEHLERAREQARLHLEEVRSRLSALEGELKALEGATFERREALRDELEGLRRELKRLEAELERKQKALLEGQKREEYWHRRSVLEASWSRLEREAEGLNATREHLERAQEARRLLPLYQELRAKEEALAEAVRKQGALEAELKRLAEKGARLAPKAERLRAVEEELSRLQGLREREALLRRWGVGLDFAHPDPLPASEGDLFALWEERAQAEAYRKAKEALEAAEQGLRALANERSRLEAEGVGAKNRLEALRAEERRRRKGALLLEKARVEEEFTSLKGRLIALRQEKERWEQERERMGLARYHARLALGQPCPLCGQTVREIPPLPSLQDPTPRIRALDEEERQLLRHSARLEEELRRLGEALEGLKEVEPEEGDPEGIAEEIARLERVILELRERYKEVGGAYRSRLEEVDRLREEVKRLSPKEPAGRTLEAIEKEWARRLAGFVRALREASSEEWPSEREARLLREKESLSSSQRRLEEVTEEEGRLKQTLIAWEARRQELEKQVQEAREKVKGLVAEEVLRSAFLTEEEERVLRERLERHEREKKEVEAALRALGDPPGPPLAPGERLR